jgi:hypothetical protein
LKPDLPGARLRLAASGSGLRMEDDLTGVLGFPCGKAEGSSDGTGICGTGRIFDN